MSSDTLEAYYTQNGHTITARSLAAARLTALRMGTQLSQSHTENSTKKLHDQELHRFGKHYQ